MDIRGVLFGGKNCHEGRGTYTIRNLKTGLEVTYSGLLMHLWERHGFGQGSNHYRVPPQTFINVLELKYSNHDILQTREMEIVGCQIIDDSTKNIEGKIRERSKE